MKCDCATNHSRSHLYRIDVPYGPVSEEEVQAVIARLGEEFFLKLGKLYNQDQVLSDDRAYYVRQYARAYLIAEKIEGVLSGIPGIEVHYATFAVREAHLFIPRDKI